jgi:D-inositol-3-phosphate glycosyltransferase
VFEPLGMFRPRLRKVALKRALDASVYRGIGSGAAAVVVASARERDDVVACGVPPSLVHVRGIGFPEPRTSEGGRHLRAALGIADGARVILYVGRIAAGKGIEHLLAASRELPDAHVVLLGPDDRHGTAALVAAAGALVHALPASEGPPFDVYPQADVFVLPSAGESFGIAAAEAAAAGTPVVVTDRCGVAGSFAAGEALVVPYEQEAVVGAIRRVLEDQALRARLARGGVDAARRNSWDRVVDRQEAIYRVAASRTAATKLSTLGS